MEDSELVNIVREKMNSFRGKKKQSKKKKKRSLSEYVSKKSGY